MVDRLGQGQGQGKVGDMANSRDNSPFSGEKPNTGITDFIKHQSREYEKGLQKHLDQYTQQQLEKYQKQLKHSNQQKLKEYQQQQGQGQELADSTKKALRELVNEYHQQSQMGQNPRFLDLTQVELKKQPLKKQQEKQLKEY